ncbi:MAG: tRNA pseudouridine(38-40) synthase TruA [Pseudomonadota bacterium]
MKRIVLGIQYDGAPWQGWQTQPNGHTVQDRLVAALKKFSQRDIAVTCAGRTDTGVHALEQVVHFDTDLDRESFSWVRGVNAFLPPSIAVRWMRTMPNDASGDFHARFSATARTYQYILYNDPIRSPLLYGKAGWVFRPLHLENMQIAAAGLIGTHDFSAFRAAQCQAKSPVKMMHEVNIERHGSMIVFTLRASAFLHHMVRNLLGSLIYVGIGNHPPAWLMEVLASRNRALAAPTFMPDGLYLVKIDYPEKWNLPETASQVVPWL